MCEYAGPLVVYLIFYTRPAIIYGVAAAAEPRANVVQLVVTNYIKKKIEIFSFSKFLGGLCGQVVVAKWSK